MEKKVLIVGSKQNRVVCEAIARALKFVVETESAIAAHDEALAVFLSGDYTHVLISDYSEKVDKERGGFASYRDMQASATGQKIIRCGFEKLDYPDYIQYPFLIPELFKKLGENER